MAKIRSFLGSFENYLNNVLRKGMEELVDTSRELLVEDYIANQSPPTSNEQELPHRDTGQLADNIVGQVLQDSSGQVGVQGYGTDRPKRHPKTRNIGGLAAAFLTDPRWNRKGMDKAFEDHEEEIVDAFVRGARTKARQSGT